MLAPLTIHGRLVKLKQKFVRQSALLTVPEEYTVKQVHQSQAATQNEMLSPNLLYSPWITCYDEELWGLLMKYIMTKSYIVAACEARGNIFRKLSIVRSHHVYMYFSTFTLMSDLISNVKTNLCSKLQILQYCFFPHWTLEITTDCPELLTSAEPW